jgi:hypothetical protein
MDPVAQRSANWGNRFASRSIFGIASVFPLKIPRVVGRDLASHRKIVYVIPGP